MCEMESRNYLTCSSSTIHSFTTTLVPSTTGTYHTRFSHRQLIFLWKWICIV